MPEQAGKEPAFRPTFDVGAADAHLRAADQRLADLMDRAGPFRPRQLHGRNPFQVLLRSIVYQQLAGEAAGAIHQRVLALFPNGVSAGPLLEMSEADLRAAGLSRAKVTAVRDLAARVMDETVPGDAVLESLSDKEIVQRLTAVRGIGRWTVEMLLLFYLGRPDVLPVQDLGIRKGFSITYDMEELPAAKELTRYAERWRPYRSVASWYMWRAVHLFRGQE